MTYTASLIRRHPHASGLSILAMCALCCLAVIWISALIPLSMTRDLLQIGRVAAVGLIVVGVGVSLYYSSFGWHLGFWIVLGGILIFLFTSFFLGLSAGPSCPPGSSNRVCV